MHSERSARCACFHPQLTQDEAASQREPRTLNAPASHPSTTPLRVWIEAARPKTLTAAAAPVLIGIGLAWADGQFRLLPAFAALMGALLIQVGTNFANDYYDFVRGGDTEQRVGPRRVTQAGLVPPTQVKRAMLLTFGTAVVSGTYLVWVGGLPILAVGLLSVLSGWAYTGGPFPLAYNGLGDIFVLIFFGPVAVAGTYWVQALQFKPELLLAGLAIGALSTAILVANNLRDLRTDQAAGKRTLPVMLGRWAGRVEYLFLVALAVVALPLGVIRYGWTPAVYFALLSILLLTPTLRRVCTEEEATALMPALPATARSAGLYGLLFALALIVAG